MAHTLNAALFTATQDYLSTVDPLNPPPPFRVEEDLLAQRGLEALGELIEASTIPFFNSDRMIEMGVQIPGRVSVPISDEDAHATYWVACRASDQSKYRSIFNTVRSYALRHDARNSR